MVLRFFKMFCLLTIATCLQYCTIPVRCYIINNTPLPKKVKFTYWRQYDENRYFPFSDTIQEPTYKLGDSFKKKMRSYPTDNGNYEIEILPKSMVLLESTMNFVSLSFSSIQIDTMNMLDSNRIYLCTSNFKKGKATSRAFWYELN
jgi:hypothetical protein